VVIVDCNLHLAHYICAMRNYTLLLLIFGPQLGRHALKFWFLIYIAMCFECIQCIIVYKCGVSWLYQHKQVTRDCYIT